MASRAAYGKPPSFRSPLVWRDIILPNPNQADRRRGAKTGAIRAMDSMQILEQEWSVLQATPVLSVVLIVIGFIIAWWLRGMISRSKIDSLIAQLETHDERRVLVEERLSAVARNEHMLQTQVTALQGHFQIVEGEVLRQGHVPALIAATGSTASTITNIALTTEALSGSLSVLRLGVGGEDNWPYPQPAVEKQNMISSS
jgi:hypothetical protein